MFTVCSIYNPISSLALQHDQFGGVGRGSTKVWSPADSERSRLLEQCDVTPVLFRHGTGDTAVSHYGTEQSPACLEAVFNSFK